MSRRVRSVLFLIVPACALAACGGSGEGNDTAPAAAPTTPVSTPASTPPPAATSPAATPPVVATPAPAPSVGSATLVWSAPTQNEDGSAVSGLAGYRIYRGQHPSELTLVATLANPASGSHTIGNLTAGTYYFSVSTYTVSGLESARSAVGSKTIP
jgi:hypothetical protein